MICVLYERTGRENMVNDGVFNSVGSDHNINVME